jgi:lysophospholipase L1-like esterase
MHGCAAEIRSPPVTAPPHLGVLAFGDSITNAGGGLQRGVALQSWALWTARGLGLPYTGYAVDGATVADVTALQIPAFTARAADPAGPYDLGCLYIGVNDVRDPGFDASEFAQGHAAALHFLHERCARVVCLTSPRRLGRPRTDPARVDRLNDAIRANAANAATAGARLVELGDFGARNHVMVDHVHPTAFGQVAIARRALAVLAADGAELRVDPVQLIDPAGSRLGALRGDASYVYGELRQRLRSRWVRSGRSHPF